MSVRIRPAMPQDVPLLCQLIRDLAVYEKLEHECRVSPEGLHAALFGPRPSAKALVGELSGVPEGFALYFTNFSTFLQAIRTTDTSTFHYSIYAADNATVYQTNNTAIETTNKSAI